MLVGNTPAAKFTRRSYRSLFKNVLEHINSLDTDDALAIGRHTLPDLMQTKLGSLYSNIKKEPLACFKPEVHKQYSDLQIVLKGSRSWLGLKTRATTSSRAYNEQRDLQF
ncbi:YhcH/YjgK/YiaL family protein [Vibrio chagasii]|nr:YhcH/YjgK/YiaL family protein [Vibrio chagasii]